MDIRQIVGRAATLGALLAATIAATPASAAIVLNFAGLDGDNQEKPLDFYNGGAGSLGSTGGTNYGVSFGADALSCSGQPGGNCNTAQIPGGAGANALFFLSGPGDIMNVAAGFTTGFSFFYTAVNQPGTVTVWDGADGTGTLLATLNLPTTTDGSGDPACFGANFCPYVAAGVAFAGTAHSVNFSGTANQIAFADITIGSERPGDVPEPATLALVGLSLAGLAVSRARKPS